MDYKKMLAVSAALIGTAAMAVESSVVGYSQSELVNGFKLMSAQFMNIGATPDYNIQNIVATGDDVESDVFLQTLTAAGKANETFSWDTWMFVEDEPAWIDDEGIATRTFAPGEAIWIQGKTGYTIQTAGQVGTDDIVVNLVNGFVAVGNPFPVSVNIQDIVATGADVESDVFLQTLTSSGKANETFSWDTWMFVEEDPAWIDDEGIATRNFAAGEGIWVQGKAGYTIRIPAPEL